MSHHESTTVTVRLTAADRCANAIASLGPVQNWVGSADLVALRRELATLAEQDETVDLSQYSPGLIEMLHVGSGGSLGWAEALRSDVLLAALGPTIDLARHTERTVVADLVGESLQSLGWHLTTAADDVVSALEGRRGDEVVLVEVRDGGATEIDFMGTCDNTCTDSMAELTADLATRDLAMKTRRVTRHNNPEGGTLIARAARGNPSDLADGLLGREAQFPVADPVPLDSRRRARRNRQGSRDRA